VPGARLAKGCGSEAPGLRPFICSYVLSDSADVLFCVADVVLDSSGLARLLEHLAEVQAALAER
jgi:hypothetical protein